MGYLGSMNFNGLHLTEQKFSGDFMSEYAQAYNLTKSATITEDGITEARRLLHSTDIDYKIRTAFDLKMKFDDMLSNRFLKLFDKQDNFVGKIRICAADHFCNSVSAYFLNNADLEELSKLDIPYSFYWNRSSMLEVDDKQLACLRRKPNINSTDLYSVFGSDKYTEIQDSIMNITNRRDIRQLIATIQERIIALSSEQIASTETLFNTENTLEDILARIRKGETFTARREADAVIVSADENEEEIKMEYAYELLPLFDNAGTNNWGSYCKINSLKEMERFIKLFPTLERRNKKLENIIISKFNDIKANSEIVDFAIGGSY